MIVLVERGAAVAKQYNYHTLLSGTKPRERGVNATVSKYLMGGTQIPNYQKPIKDCSSIY